MTKVRIVSLLPACTEIACALGLEKQLVGRSHECDFPESIKKLPACTSAKFVCDVSSGEIDRQVKSLQQSTSSLYELNRQLIQELQPTHILTQAQCDVCAVHLADVEQMVAPWSNPKPKIIAINAERLSDLWKNVREIAMALDVENEGKAVIKPLKNRVADIIMKTCQFEKRPSVVCLEWLDPIMAAGNWIPELVELAGGNNLFGETGKHSDWLPWKQVVDRDPEVIVLMPCGFGIQRTRSERNLITEFPSWARLRAVRDKRVYVVDANQYFNRPGPRLVDSLEILAEILHPGIFRIRYEPIAWQGF